MIDTHTHLQFQAFEGIVDQVIKESLEAGIEKMIVVGTNIETSIKALDLAQKYESLYASVGIHPHHIFAYLNNRFHPRGGSLGEDLKQIEKLITDEKVIAVGEVGMDRQVYGKTKYENYKVTEKFIDLQKKAFAFQIKLAIKYKKTLIIHNILAVSKLLEILDDHLGGGLSLKVVFHCCEPDERLLAFAKEHHIYIGIDGDITEYPAKQEFIKKVPLDLLVLETDSPFLAPIGFKFPNTPKNLIEINNFIADLLNKDSQELKKIVTDNSIQLFFRLT